jgi:23S rRNA pseudouridine1911/1915/1917 synthase
MKITYDLTTRERLDKFLVERLPLSRSKIQELITIGQITVNNVMVAPHFFLKANDVIEYTVGQIKELAKKKTFEANKNVKFKIIDKPSGLLVHPTELMETETLANGLLAKYPKIKNVGDDAMRPGIVHRLDKEVSGILLVAKNQKAFEYYKNLFKTRKIKKIYTALVHGKMEQSDGEVNLPISRSATGSGKMAAHAPSSGLGKEAATRYRVEKQFQYLALLSVELLTGRSHQIRVHMNAISHPIVGDTLYTQKIKQGIELDRIFLHSSILEFIDQNGELKRYESKLPKELNAILSELENQGNRELVS